jgi:integrase
MAQEPHRRHSPWRLAALAVTFWRRLVRHLARCWRESTRTVDQERRDGAAACPRAKGCRRRKLDSWAEPAAKPLRTEVADRDGDALVFESRRGGYLTLAQARDTFTKAVTAVGGIDGVRLHDLRHTCASLAISAGANVKVVQRLLGHKTATLTLDRYGHLFPDDLDAVADAFDAAADALRTAAVGKPLAVVRNGL